MANLYIEPAVTNKEITEEFLTVSEINCFIKDVINAGFPRALWICGEIQQYDRNKNKNHIFLN